MTNQLKNKESIVGVCWILRIAKIMTSNLTYSTIKSAISGDANAINAVVDFFNLI